MTPKIFISADSLSDQAALRAALRVAGFEALLSGDALPDQIQDLVNQADAALLVLPSIGSESRTTFLYALGVASGASVPIVLVEPPGASPITALVDHFIRVRSDLLDPEPLVNVLRAVLEHATERPVADGTHTQTRDRLVLSQKAAHQWRTVFRDAATESPRFERQVAMFMAELGIELSTPDEPGPDFIAWSDDAAGSLGTPFLVEVKRSETLVNEDIHERWMQRSGVRALLVVVADEYAARATRWTVYGGTVLQVPAAELVDAAEGRTFGGALDLLARQIGVA